MLRCMAAVMQTGISPSVSELISLLLLDLSLVPFEFLLLLVLMKKFLVENLMPCSRSLMDL